MADYDDNEEYYLCDDDEEAIDNNEPILVNIEEEDEMSRSEESLQKREEKVKDKPKIALDYTLKTPQERNELVKKIIESASPEQLTPYYLDILGTYIVLAMDKKEKKEKLIQTPNRLKGTVYVRETSLQGLASSFEQGEDGLYNLITDDYNKNIILTPKDPITQKDIDEIPELKALVEEIEKVEERFKKARGKNKYLLKKQIMEMHADKYIIRASHRPAVKSMHLTKITSGHINLDEKISVNDKGDVVVDGLISCTNPQHVAALLSNYTKLKEESWGKFDDLYYQMDQLDDLIEQVFSSEENLIYMDIIRWKIDGLKNEIIRQKLIERYGTTYSEEYISSLWKNKIPKMIAEQCEKNYLEWYYTNVEKGLWKRCNSCGQIKLANHHYFSKNKTSKDGFYSICKDCRSQKYKEKKGK